MEGSYDEFTFEGTDGGKLKAIVDYCYCGYIDLTVDNVKTFVTIASSVELDLLEKECRQFYVQNLSPNTAVEALMTADTFSFLYIRRKAFKLICKKFDEVPLAAFQQLDHRLLQESTFIA